MTRLPDVFYAHDECGCHKAPFIGARYRRMGRDVFTGKDTGMEFYTVTDVEPVRHDRIMCRRLTLESDGGWVGHPQVNSFFDQGYEAIDNVVAIGEVA